MLEAAMQDYGFWDGAAEATEASIKGQQLIVRDILSELRILYSLASLRLRIRLTRGRPTSR